MAIADGSYEILPLIDVTMAVDVQGNSVANSATVFLWSRNGGNAQKWSLENEGSYYTIKDAETGKSLDVQGSARRNGARCIMYTYSNAENQRWTITEVGTQAVNGTAYPVVTIGAFAGSAYVLDVQGSSNKLRTYIEIWTANGGNNQKFVLIPTEWEATSSAKTLPTKPNTERYFALPTPTLGTGGPAMRDAQPSTFALESGSVYPAWTCDALRYQLRYRTRTREAGAEWFSEWSNWKSIADGSTAWDGFGTPGQSNCNFVRYLGVKWSTRGVPVDNGTTYDRTDVEVCVRAWTDSWTDARVPAHGASYTYDLITVRPVTITGIGALLTPDGITVTWTTDCLHDGNAITLTSDVWGTHTTTGAASDNVAIPQYLMKRMPAEGETIRIDMAMQTADGLTVTATESVAVQFDGTHGTGLTLHASVNGTIATVTASDASARAWLVVPQGHGTRYVPLAGSSPWKVPAPIGVTWSVFASVTDGDEWASVLQPFSAINDSGWHITSQDLTKDLSVYVGAGESPKADPSYSRSVNSVEVVGRERPLYLPSDATEASWTLGGVTYGEWMHEDVNLADWAVHAGHVYFRSPQGFWAQACVTGGTVEQTRMTMRAISVSMQGEVW